MNNIWALIGIVVSALVSIWAILRFIITQSFRIDDNLSKNLIDYIKLSKIKFEIDNEYSINKKYPNTYACIGVVENVWFYFRRSERLLNAGWQSKDVVSHIYFFRWQKSDLENIIKKISKSEDKINVMALLPNGSDKLGELSVNEVPNVYIDDDLYFDIEKDIIDMLNGKINKTSCLLYGTPGSGKSRLVKYFAQKYKLPIYSIFLNPEFNNIDILMMFNSIPEKCIVLFEDFDNYFNNRECIIKNENLRFTFDVILNVLDGVYNDYRKTLFMMTCNDIKKIDDSLKNRPSRFKFVREITQPSFKKRLEIFDDLELAELTEDMTLDKIFVLKSLLQRHNKKEALEYFQYN